MSDPSLERFLARVKESTVRKSDISLEDEVYYDLKVYGDPLFDLLSDLSEAFGTDFSEMKVNEYAPGEGAELIRPILVAFGRKPFPSLKVSDLWHAVQIGRLQSIGRTG